MLNGRTKILLCLLVLVLQSTTKISGASIANSDKKVASSEKDEHFSLVPRNPHIEIETLHLHYFLVSLLNYLKQKNSVFDEDKMLQRDEGDAFFAAQMLVEKALKYMKDIVAVFNSEQFAHTPELSQRFIRMCNALPKVECNNIKHWDIYQQCERIKIFNNRVMQYCATYTNFLDSVDSEFFKNLALFNYAVLFCLNQEDLFDCGIIDSVIDLIFYKPLRHILDHPWLVTAIIGGFLFLLGCEFLYLYKYYPAQA